MFRVTKERLERLARTQHPRCMTITLPLRHLALQDESYAIELSTLLKDAGREIRTLGVDADAHIGAASAALDAANLRDGVRRHHSGVMAYVGGDEATIAALTQPCTAGVIVGDAFHIKPLIAEVATAGPVYTLSLARGAVELAVMRSNDDLSALTVPALPESLEAALALDDRERTVSAHSGSSPGRGRFVPVVHGQGGRGDELGADVDRFVHAIAGAIAPVVGRSPLVVVAGAPLSSAFRRVAQTPIAASIHRDPAALSGPELSDIVRATVRDLADADDEELVSDIAELAPTRRATLDLEEIEQAATEGRVRTLVVASDVEVWENAAPGDPADRRQPGSSDRLNLAVIDAVRTGADVRTVAANRFAGTGNLAGALLRY